MKLRGKTYSAHKNFSPQEKCQSSTWRELQAILYSVESFSPLLKGGTIFWETDNQAVPIIARKGSGEQKLQHLASNLYFLCKRRHITLDIVWIPREQNAAADRLSKDIDFDDWRTSQTMFEGLDIPWGPHTIDRFADHHNAKTARFNSRHWAPSTGVNAFSQDWSHDNNWLVPPIHLISKTIVHVQACSAIATLVVPFWSSAPYWPLLHRAESQFYEFVIDARIWENT